MAMALERSYRFSAAHRYHRPEWTDEENLSRFGRCAWAPGHGHNYRLTLWVEAEPDALTGFVVDLPALDELVRVRVLDRLDHRHLNDALPEFASGGSIPSSENIARWIATDLLPHLPPHCRLARLRLAEDDDLAAVWTPD